MVLMYEVTGYDSQTGRLAVSYGVPKQKMALVKKIAGVASADDGLGSDPLGSDQTSKIAKALKTKIEQGKFDFYLEPYDEAQESLSISRTGIQSV